MYDGLSILINELKLMALSLKIPLKQFYFETIIPLTSRSSVAKLRFISLSPRRYVRFFYRKNTSICIIHNRNNPLYYIYHWWMNLIDTYAYITRIAYFGYSSLCKIRIKSKNYVNSGYLFMRNGTWAAFVMIVFPHSNSD